MLITKLVTGHKAFHLFSVVLPELRNHKVIDLEHPTTLVLHPLVKKTVTETDLSESRRLGRHKAHRSFRIK